MSENKKPECPSCADTGYLPTPTSGAADLPPCPNCPDVERVQDTSDPCDRCGTPAGQECVPSCPFSPSYNGALTVERWSGSRVLAHASEAHKAKLAGSGAKEEKEPDEESV